MKLIFVVSILCQLKTITSKNCFWNKESPYKYFASKCLYNILRGDIRDSVSKIANCTPVSIWMIMRHGKRNPSKFFAKDMQETIVVKDYAISSYDNGNSSLCAQDVDNLRTWVLDDEIFNNVNLLTREGYQEMVNIGQRLKQAFPNLLAQLDEEEFTFRSLKSPRLVESMKGFVEGLNNNNLTIEPAKIHVYDILAPFKSCEVFTNEVIINYDTFREVRKYMRNFEYLTVKNGIQRRLGIYQSLTDKNIMAIYNFCRSTSSGIENKFSPWCAMLSTQDLMAMEYIEDLKHYYRNGYGTPMAPSFGELVLSDLLIKFRKARSNGNKITAYITDSTLLDMLYTALGLFKDDLLLTGEKIKSDRQWRTSSISSFTSNLIAVLHRCGEDESDYKIVFYLNEEPLRTICKKGVCSWKEFEDKFSPFLDTKLESFCK